MAALAPACSDGGSSDSDQPDTLGGTDAGDTDAGETNAEASIAQYLQELPTWAEFSPALDAQQPLPVPGVEPVLSVEVVEGVEMVNEDGEVDVLGDVTYECSEVPFSMASNPGKIVMSDPNRDVIYPGAFIQGRTHRDGISIGDVLPITVEKRAPIRVSIPDIASPVGENFREVQPNQAYVAAAIGNMVGNAAGNNLDTPSSISFEMQTYHSEQQFALSAGVSGRYLGFSASASGSVTQNASTNTVAVQFTQRMFTVVVEPPGSGPESFFADDFTVEDLQALQEGGRIGPDNLPVYVSNAVYGRMMTFTLTSTASESDIRAALQASYNTIAGGASGSLSTEHKSILSNSSIVLTTLGGNAEDALSVIRSGDWSAYFTKEAPLSTAVPLSYTFKNLGDNSIAAVSETADYTVKTCQAQQANPGVFDPLEPQNFELGIGTVAEVIVANSDGDEYDDLVFNHRDADNRVVVLHGSQDGVLTRGEVDEYAGADAPTTWTPYRLRAGDVDGDGDADLVWNYNAGSCEGDPICRENSYYVGLSGGGTDTPGDAILFKPRVLELIPSAARFSYPFHLLDLNQDGMVEPVLAAGLPDGAGFATRATASLGAGEIRTVWWYDGFPGTGSDEGGTEGDQSYFGDFVGDFNRDGMPDILWNRRIPTADGSGDPLNRIRLVTGNPALDGADPASMPLYDVFDNDLGKGDIETAPEGTWDDGYQALAGDVDLDGADDLVWVATMAGTAHIQTALGSEVGFTPDGLFSSSEIIVTEDGPSDLDARLADVGGSDGADLILNQRDGTINRIFVGLSLGDGTFDFGSVPQDIFANEAWSQYTLLVGNFGGSPKQDLAWVSATDSTRVYLAIAK